MTITSHILGYPRIGQNENLNLLASHIENQQSS